MDTARAALGRPRTLDRMIRISVREVSDPSELAVVGDRSALQAAALRAEAAGATDFQATPFGTPEQCEATIAALAEIRQSGVGVVGDP